MAELLLPNIDKTPEYYENLYPERPLPEGARVTRFAPSPTGYLHLGGLFGATADLLTAKSTKGVFILRIEDTDKKREIEDGVTAIIEGLSSFGVEANEGVTGLNTEVGDYGPYTQSKRKDIYPLHWQAFLDAARPLGNNILTTGKPHHVAGYSKQQQPAHP